jgi:hypothetical protein
MVNAFWTALYSRLAGGTALTALLGGTYIYHGQALDGKVPPYVVYSIQGGGYTPTSRHVDANAVIYVRGYSSVSALAAGSISEAVGTLLDRLPLTVTGWTNAELQAEAPHIQFSMTDESGKITWTSGDQYRVLLDKN